MIAHPVVKMGEGMTTWETKPHVQGSCGKYICKGGIGPIYHKWLQLLWEPQARVSGVTIYALSHDKIPNIITICQSGVLGARHCRHLCSGGVIGCRTDAG